MHARIMMLWGDAPSKALSLSVQEVLGDLAVAFGHSFLFKEERFADASLESFGCVLTQETIDACLSNNAVLALSRSGEGLLSLAAGLGARLGSHHYDFPACMTANSRLRSAQLPKGLLSFPIFAEPEPLLDAARQALRLAGRDGLRHLPFAGRLRDAWHEALRLAEEELSGPKPELSELEDELQRLVLSPESFGHVLAQPAACQSLDCLARAVSGLPGFVWDSYASDRPVLFAARVSGRQTDGDGPFGLLYAAADMLARTFGLRREADCLRASVTNVLEAGWRTPDVALGDAPRMSAGAICGLVREQIALAGQLITH